MLENAYCSFVDQGYLAGEKAKSHSQSPMRAQVLYDYRSSFQLFEESLNS